MLVWTIAVATAAPLAECPRVFRAAELDDAAAGAQAAFGRMDADGFARARTMVRTRLECAGDPLDGGQIGAVHRVEAMAAFLDGPEGRMSVALAGMLAADPGYQFPAAVVPEGHRIRSMLPSGGNLLRTPGGRDLVPATNGWYEVDGAGATQVSSKRAAVVQRFDSNGMVLETRYVWPDDDLGDWAAPPPTPMPAAAMAGPEPTASELGADVRAHAPLLAGTVVSLAASGILFAMAASSESDFKDASVQRSMDELGALRTRANTLSWGWIAAGTAGLGLGALLVVTW